MHYGLTYLSTLYAQSKLYLLERDCLTWTILVWAHENPHNNEKFRSVCLILCWAIISLERIYYLLVYWTGVCIPYLSKRQCSAEWLTIFLHLFATDASFSMMVLFYILALGFVHFHKRYANSWRGPVPWLPQYLLWLDVFLWGHVKNSIYNISIESD